MYEFPMAREILKNPLDIRDGDLHVPRTPGLGVPVGSTGGPLRIGPATRTSQKAETEVYPGGAGLSTPAMDAGYGRFRSS